MRILLPRHLVLEITRACNYRCPSCGTDAGAALKDELTKEEIFALIAKVRPDHLLISGGEPLLRKDVFEIVDFGKRFGLVSINTNASLLTREAAGKLNADHIHISIDGLEAVNARLRDKDCFRDVERALDNLEAAGKLGRVMLGITVSKDNLGEVDAVIRHFSPRVRKFGLGRLAPIGRALPEKITTRLEAAKLYWKLLPLRLRHRIVFYAEFGGLCRMVTSDLTVLSDGSLLSCCLLRKPVGNIRTAKRLPWLPKSCLLFCSGCADCRALRK